ncbi:MAG: cyclodeaminase/cyclohydrolase family protein [Coriobacteriales bacterium]|nr:cyclodeaminase/cyclohydrolase family protein [Coriobacteriales bacterium]
MERLTDRTCAGFAEVLAAKESVPGGGGAAALAGALGVALGSMVGNYTTGKKTYAAVEDDVQRMLADAETIRLRLIELVEEDAAAFYPLSQAYGIPRDDPSRAQVLEEATKGACVAPLEMMRQIARAIDLLEEMGQKGSRMLISDVGCGALLCRAALEAASLNVFVNTKTLHDRELAESIEAECDELLATFVPRAEACATMVTKRIRGLE